MDDLMNALEALGADPQSVMTEVFMNDWQFYCDCLKKFPQDNNMELLRKAMKTSDTPAAIRAAHTLKGIADNLGLLPVVDAAYSVLSDLRAGGEKSRTDADMEELESVYSKFYALLNG